MANVIVFNTTPFALTVGVNNGPVFSIPAAGAPNYFPQSPSSGGPGWSQTYPAPNVLAPGQNFVSVTASGSPQPQNLAVSLPGHFPWQSLQLYLFSNGQTYSWIALNAGSFVTGNLS